MLACCPYTFTWVCYGARDRDFSDAEPLTDGFAPGLNGHGGYAHLGSPAAPVPYTATGPAHPAAHPVAQYYYDPVTGQPRLSNGYLVTGETTQASHLAQRPLAHAAPASPWVATPGHGAVPEMSAHLPMGIMQPGIGGPVVGQMQVPEHFFNATHSGDDEPMPPEFLVRRCVTLCCRSTLFVGLSHHHAANPCLIKEHCSRALQHHVMLFPSRPIDLSFMVNTGFAHVRVECILCLCPQVPPPGMLLHDMQRAYDWAKWQVLYV